MKNFYYLIVAALLALGVVVAAAPATAQTNQGVGVTGHTYWGQEYYDTLDQLRGYGIDIQDGCDPTDLCVVLSHYSANDGIAALTTWDATGTRVKLNDTNEKGYWYRRTTLMHEFGHVLGLNHQNSCDTSMAPVIGQCGHYLVGYTATEIQTARTNHGY